MSGLANLRAVAQGARPRDDGLLGNARFAWGQSELLSEEAILASFAAHPFKPDGAILTLETPSNALLLGDGGALVADLYGGKIGRLWRIGGEVESPSETRIDVAFDPDMRQERGDVNFRAEDHPHLDPASADRLLSATSGFTEKLRLEGKLRVRGFFVRAFGGPQASAALISVFALDNETARSAAFSYAVIGVGENADEVHVAYDPPPARGWTPRL